MIEERKPHNSQWVVVSFNRPVMWSRNSDEVWMFNPQARYILNANQIGNLGQYVETVSDLKGQPTYKPVAAGVPLTGSKILVERYRERGIGDLLFMTGPLNYMHHVTGGQVNVDMYAMADRGMVLNFHPTLRYAAPLAGPLRLEDLSYYDYHWFVDTVTEYDEEPGQANVYDALYAGLGFDPETIPAKFKRPTAVITDEDRKNLDQFLYAIWMEKKLDLRRTGYYVVAPFSNSSIRSMPYDTWLHVIRTLATKRPVVVVGNLRERMPETDMSAGEFNQHVQQSGGNVVNRIGATPLRVLMAVISGSVGVGCLDSGPLYIAQALGVPAVSVWGAHDPRVRIGYDPAYMRLAVWNKEACRRSPCFAYARFPESKCPDGPRQTVCEVLKSVDKDTILANFETIESENSSVGLITRG